MRGTSGGGGRRRCRLGSRAYSAWRLCHGGRENRPMNVVEAAASRPGCDSRAWRILRAAQFYPRRSPTQADSCLRESKKCAVAGGDQPDEEHGARLRPLAQQQAHPAGGEVVKQPPAGLEGGPGRRSAGTSAAPVQGLRGEDRSRPRAGHPRQRRTSSSSSSVSTGLRRKPAQPWSSAQSRLMTPAPVVTMTGGWGASLFSRPGSASRPGTA